MHQFGILPGMGQNGIISLVSNHQLWYLGLEVPWWYGFKSFSTTLKTGIAGGDVRKKLKIAPFVCKQHSKNRAQDDQQRGLLYFQATYTVEILLKLPCFIKVPKRNEIYYNYEGALPNLGIGNTKKNRNWDVQRSVLQDLVPLDKLNLGKGRSC